MANANIFQQYLQAPRSVIDYSNDYAKADSLRNANAMQALQLGQAANVQTQRNALQALVQSGGTDLTTPGGQAHAIAIAPDVAPAMIKTVQDGITGGAAAAKDTAQAGNFTAEAGATNFKTQVGKANQAITDITSLGTPQDALASLNAHLQKGDIDPVKYQGVLATLQPSLQDPTQFGKWQRQMVLNIMDAKDKIAATAPKVAMTNVGGSIVPTNENADAGPVGAIAGAAPIVTTVSPDTRANNATSRANNAANIQKDLTVAGINSDGTVNGGQEAMAQLIAAGKAPAPSGMAAARPGVGALMARVAQINPDYDATTYGAKVAAAKGFTAGPQGNQMRSFQVANDHLDQLLTMAQALNNGNFPLVNKIGNAFGVQTGQEPAAVFNAVRNLVGPEITSAIVSGGGSAHERDAAAATFDPSSSPAQFVGTVGATRNLMQAKYNAMLAQRRAAGLPDSTLPAYAGAGQGAPAQGTTPGGWSYLGTAGGSQ